MTRFWLIILRIICGIQLVITAYSSLFALTVLFLGGGFMALVDAIAFALIAALPVRVFIILGNNYPDKIIEGKPKKNFNRIFLINILLISYLLTYVIRDFKSGMNSINDNGFFIFFLFSFIGSLSILVIHLCILYSLFWLRKQIVINAGYKDFEFENKNENV
jgi:hypothetical protein